MRMTPHSASYAYGGCITPRFGARLNDLREGIVCEEESLSHRLRQVCIFIGTGVYGTNIFDGRSSARTSQTGSAICRNAYPHLDLRFY